MRTGGLQLLGLASTAAALDLNDARALFSQAQSRLNLNLGCAGAACTAERARTLLAHEGFLTELAEGYHDAAAPGMLRQLMNIPRTLVKMEQHGRGLAAAAGVQDWFSKNGNAFNATSGDCEARYKPGLSRVYSEARGCSKLAASYANPFLFLASTPAPTPSGGGSNDDSCAEGGLMDSSYHEYTCNYEMQPIGCHAAESGKCQTNSPSSVADGRWAEKTFENKDCKAGMGSGCDGKWNTNKNARYAADIRSQEGTCASWPSRAKKDGISVSSSSLYESCTEATNRQTRRVVAAAGPAVVIIVIVIVLLAAGCRWHSQKRKARQDAASVVPQMQQQQPQMVMQGQPQMMMQGQPQMMMHGQPQMMMQGQPQMMMQPQQMAIAVPVQQQAKF
jgi:hypothetical protein